jgi:hypothetical protein
VALSSDDGGTLLPADVRFNEYLHCLWLGAATSGQKHSSNTIPKPGCYAKLNAHDICLSMQRPHLIAGLEHFVWQVTLPVAADGGRGAGAAPQRRHWHTALILPCPQGADTITW